MQVHAHMTCTSGLIAQKKADPMDSAFWMYSVVVLLFQL